MAHAQQPSLGDLARKVEAERAATPKTTVRTYTNADLTGDTSTEPAVTATGDGYVSKSLGKAVSADEIIDRSEAVAAGVERERQRPESYWRGRADFIRRNALNALALLTGLVEFAAKNSSDVAARHAAKVTLAEEALARYAKEWDELEASAAAAKAPLDWLGPRPAFTLVR